LSLLLIAVTALLLVALYGRVTARARSAVHSWARDYGFQVVSLRFVAIFSREYREAGREAEVVYRAVLDSASGERVSAHFLIWNLLWGPMTVVVRWSGEPPPDDGS
jgi:hypothetical protein